MEVKGVLKERVCAVVVTYNRKVLLRECLQALLGQARVVDEIVVVDNASTDGTDEMLAGEFAAVHVLRLPQNVGGAGGFHAGMKWAYQEGFDWVWLMDDDTITEGNTLNALLEAKESFGEAVRPCLLASKVVWTDGSLHPMNISSAKRLDKDPEGVMSAAEHSTVSVRWASFVSLLLHRSMIERYGLPVADYFIWNDDAEYTARVLRHEFGVLVPASRVVHKTEKKHTALDAAPQRYYYQVRNVIWMLTRSNAWSGEERTKIMLVHSRWVFAYLRRSRFSWPSIRAVGSGLRDGIFRAPKTVGL
jgi:GT2 family glycosyltransferase